MVTRASVAIVGAAESDLGAVAALMSPIDLMAQGRVGAGRCRWVVLRDDPGADLGDVAGRVSGAA